MALLFTSTAFGGGDSATQIRHSAELCHGSVFHDTLPMSDSMEKLTVMIRSPESLPLCTRAYTCMLLNSDRLDLRRVHIVLYLRTPYTATRRRGSVTIPLGISQKNEYSIEKRTTSQRRPLR